MWKLFRRRSEVKKTPYVPPDGRFTGDIVTQLPGLRGPSLWGGQRDGLADIMQPSNIAGNFRPTLDKTDDPFSR